MNAKQRAGIRLATVDGQPVPPDPRLPRTDAERELIELFCRQSASVRKAYLRLFRAIVAAQDEGDA